VWNDNDRPLHGSRRLHTHTALKVNPAARVYAVSLSDKQGGHRILVPFGKKDPRITVSIVDITMLSGEMGCDSIPSDHPDYASFTRKRVFPNVECDVVVCDGHVLRTHSRHPYREASEAWRLTCSQFVFALQRIKSGGRLVMLLHKVDSWCSCQLLYAFSKFSHIVLFKPKRKHATRRSFYRVAKDVQPATEEAKAAVKEWKQAWLLATFGERPSNYNSAVQQEQIARVLHEFGESLIQLARPVWEIQRYAVSKASFLGAQSVARPGPEDAT
jgi:FtsJ-like methyltransferase